MSYSIVTVIYGVPITERLLKRMTELSFSEHADKNDDHEFLFDEEELLDEEEMEDFGPFETQYSASGGFTPGYCGVKLGQFDECRTFLSSEDVRTTPTAEEKKNANEMVSQIDPRLSGFLEKIGTYYIFSSS